MVPSLYKIRTFLFLLAISALFFGCSKSGRVRWIHYDETYCSDRWDHNINNEKYKDNVVAYLKKQNVKVLEIEIFTDRTPDSCTDCTCKTGRRVKCKIKRNDLKAAKKEGFYEN